MRNFPNELIVSIPSSFSSSSPSFYCCAKFNLYLAFELGTVGALWRSQDHDDGVANFARNLHDARFLHCIGTNHFCFCSNRICIGLFWTKSFREKKAFLICINIFAKPKLTSDYIPPRNPPLRIQKSKPEM